MIITSNALTFIIIMIKNNKLMHEKSNRKKAKVTVKNNMPHKHIFQTNTNFQNAEEPLNIF